MNKKGLIIGLTTTAIIGGLSCTAFIPGVKKWFSDNLFGNTSLNIGWNSNNISNNQGGGFTDGSISLDEFKKTYKIELPSSFTGSMYVYPSINNNLLLRNSAVNGLYFYDFEKEKLICLASFSIDSSTLISLGNGDYLYSSNASTQEGVGLYLFDSETKSVKRLLATDYAFKNFCFLPNNTVVIGKCGQSSKNFYLYDINSKVLSILKSCNYNIGTVYQMQDNRVLLCPSSSGYAYSIYDYRTGEVKDLDILSLFSSDIFFETSNFVFMCPVDTSAKLQILDKRTGEIVNNTNLAYRVVSVFELDNGNVLFSIYNQVGVYLLNSETFEIRKVFNTLSSVYYFERLSNGYILGLPKFNSTNNYSYILDMENEYIISELKFSGGSLYSLRSILTMPGGNLLVTVNETSHYIFVDVQENTLSDIHAVDPNISQQMINGDFLISGCYSGLCLVDSSTKTFKTYFTNYLVKEIIDNKNGTYTIKFENFNDVEYDCYKEHFYFVYDVESTTY